MKSFCFFIFSGLLLAAVQLANAQTFNSHRRADIAVGQQVSTLRNAVQSVAESLRARMDAMEACNARKSLYAPEDENADPDGCVNMSVNVQAGHIDGGKSNKSRTIHVAFKKPFGSVPDVSVAVSEFRYHNNCKEDWLDIVVSAENITKNGFDFEINGSGRCGGHQRVERALWIAEGE